MTVPEDERRSSRGRRASDYDPPGDPTARRTVVVLAILTLLALGSAGVQWSTFRDYRDGLYQRCVDAKPAGQAANDFRRLEVEAFRRFAADPTVPDERRQEYLLLVAAGEEAVASYRPPDCERTYR